MLLDGARSRRRGDSGVEDAGAGVPRSRETSATTTFAIDDSIPRAPTLQAQSSSQQEVASRYTPELAAMLIFLNRTGFNGLFRLNRRGGFNVPAGRYTDPRICDEPHIRAVGAALQQRSRVDHALAVRRDAGPLRTRRLRLLRSAVRATQSHVELRPLHGRRLHVVRSVAASAGGRRRVQTWRACRGVELERRGDHEGLHDARCAEGATQDQPRPGKTCHQLASVLTRPGR